MASSQSKGTSVLERTRRRRRVIVTLVATVVILVWILALVLEADPPDQAQAR